MRTAPGISLRPWRRAALLLGSMALLSPLHACKSDPLAPELVSRELAGSDVVLPAGDLVFRYLLPTVNADSLLRLMRADGVPVKAAWLPLEDLCVDPQGPRFTVELARPFDEILAYHFEPGSGIRACTVRVRRFRWSS